MTHLDEPDRVDFLTSKILPRQTGKWNAHTKNGTEFSLRLGADAKDDCAVFSTSGPLDIVIGTDYVRGSKFSMYEFGLMDDYDIGYYLVGANLSDIAAMGAQPAGFLSVVRYPKEMSDSKFFSIIEGIRDACAKFGIHSVGGDIGTAERVILSGSAIGIADRGKSLSRSGANPGDLLVLSGPTGVAGAALKYFTAKPTMKLHLSDADEAVLKDAWRRVRPQIALGMYLSDNELATSCQDTSDGLKATVEQLARSSGVGFTLEADQLFIHPVVLRVAERLEVDPLTIVFGDSVDFKLLFTVPPESNVEVLLQRFPDCSVIGRATASEENIVRQYGDSLSLPGSAWRH